MYSSELLTQPKAFALKMHWLRHPLMQSDAILRHLVRWCGEQACLLSRFEQLRGFDRSTRLLDVASKIRRQTRFISQIRCHFKALSNPRTGGSETGLPSNPSHKQSLCGCSDFFQPKNTSISVHKIVSHKFQRNIEISTHLMFLGVFKNSRVACTES